MFLTSVSRWVILAFIVGGSLFLSLHPLQEFEYVVQSDEGCYFKYATLLFQKGLPAFNHLISWYTSSDEALKHPAPVRVGYMLLSAFLFKLFGGANFAALSLISTFSFFIFLFISFHYVRKYFDLDTALLTTLFLASSPLMLGLSRRALVDSPANLLWGLAVWLFLDVLFKPNRFSYIFFLTTLIVAITFKEGSIILIPFFMLAGILGRSKGAVISNVQIAGIVILPVLLLFCFYSWILGGVGVLLAAIMAIAKVHFSAHYPNPYALEFSSGPWFKYLLDFLLLNPVVTILFIGYTGYLCVQRNFLDYRRMYFLLYFVYVYAVLNFLPHSKVVRFVINLEMVMALFAVLMLQELFRELVDRQKRFFLMYASFGIFIFNWFSFFDLFYWPSLLDPISLWLLIYRHFIPG